MPNQRKLYQPQIEDGQLLPAPEATAIPVGSLAWYSWLETSSVFLFRSMGGSFSARKEPGRNGGWYWRAYRRRSGRLFTHYLGRSSDLTLERLETAAQLLAGSSGGMAEGRAAPPPTPAPADPLLQTKLFVPALRTQRVVRRRLHARLERSNQAHALVVAPPGFGKTTLVADWLTTTGRAAAWLSLDPDDNNPVRFWLALGLALERLQPGCASALLTTVGGPQGSSAVQTLAGLVILAASALAPDPQGRPALLVLDDYHLIQQPAIHETLALLLDRLPPALRLVLISRSEPPLPLGRLRVRDLLSDVRAADLAFTPPEIAAFVRTTLRLELPANALATLSQRTEGWVAALQLAVLACAGQPDLDTLIAATSGSQQQLLGYLVDEVLERQPPAVQQFLLATAVLDRLSPALCTALLEPDVGAPLADPQAILADLAQSNLFLLPLDDQGRWYRYHPLFAEMLRARLRTTAPAREPELRARAAAWFAAQGALDEAIGQLQAAEDWDGAARLIEDAADTLWSKGAFQSVDYWLRTIPPDVLKRRPLLALVQVHLLHHHIRYDLIAPLLDQIEAMLEHGPVPLLGSGLPASTLRGRLLIYRSRLVRLRDRDPRRAEELLHTALTLLAPEDHFFHAEAAMELGTLARLRGDLAASQHAFSTCISAARRAGAHFTVSTGIYGAAVLLYEQGWLGATQELLKHGLGELAHIRDQPFVQMPLEMLLGGVAYERNELARADEYLRCGNTPGRPSFFGAMAVSYTKFLVTLYLATGRVEAALAQVAMVEQQISGSNVTSGMPILLALRAHAQAAQGDRAALARWAAEAATPLAQGLPPLNMSQRIVPMLLMRAWLLLGEHAEALALARRIDQRMEADGLLGLRVELLAAQACALVRLGQQAAALVAIEQALALGVAGGYVRSFLDNGPVVAEALALWLASPAQAEQHRLRAYGRAVLSAFPSTGATALVLSPREHELLALVAAGLTNQQIAAQLYLSLNTVKWYLRELFAKLDARTRTQAVAQARILRLID